MGLGILPHVRLVLPAQPVDATPSNALIRQCFPGRSDLFGCPRSKPSQGSVPADLTLASDLAFVFNASRVRLERCVDPLRPPGLSDKCSGRIPQEGSSRILGWPGYLTGAAVGQIGDLAGAGCGNSGFDWRVGLFAGLDAIEEILQVVDGAIAEAVCP